MPRRLPNLNQLRAFEAAARHESFKAAAEELSVTQTAISHQIKALEEDFGQPLFHRLTRKVRLTEEARPFAIRLGAAFAEIGDASEVFRSDGATRPLRLTSAPFYGNRVLIPALPAFRILHPEIEVEISLDYGFRDLRADGLDAGIRYGDGNWPGITAIKIHSDTMGPIAAPSLAGAQTLPLSPEEIGNLPLAVDRMSEGSWEEWFAATGTPFPKTPQFWRFDNRAMVLDFALAGNGAALTDLRIAHSELEACTLRRLHPTTIDWGRAMWLAYPETDTPDPRLRQFADWLRETTAAMDLSVGAP